MGENGAESVYSEDKQDESLQGHKTVDREKYEAQLDAALKNVRNPQVENDLDIVNYIRPAASAEIDPFLTNHPEGIFEHGDVPAQRRIGYFLTHLLDGVLALERGVMNGAHAFGQENEQRASIHTWKRERHDERNFSQLAGFLSDIADFPDKPQEIKDGFYVTEMVMEGGRRIKKQMPRYTLSSQVKVYKPHDTAMHGKIIENARGYNNNYSANVDFILADKVSGKRMVLEFFPIGYKHYNNAPHLEGASAGAATEMMRTHAVRQRDISEITSNLEQSSEDAVEPYFQLRLEDEEGEEIAAVEGEVVKGKYIETRDQTNSVERIGFNLFPVDFPDLTTFVPFPERNHFKNEEDRVLAKNIPMKGILDDFKGVGLKTNTSYRIQQVGQMAKSSVKK